MTKEDLEAKIQFLLAHVVELTDQVRVLSEEKLVESKKAALATVLAEEVAQSAINDAKTAESMALVASVAVKACHLHARTQNNIELIELTEQADCDTQKVYDFTMNLCRNNHKNLEKISSLII
ncbi:hypothetical protein ICN42_11815 [Polynucleobacter sp. 71A-WALBACH]|uniref:hypothetical protein n=1 Tax=Polynucleobacter sp. 71A-WALBACH TaxID=2689097 RepID=UPI001C0A9A9F|nr:hypothetical protein [Polynucleobacter sp. 71A-WALBACH]MBU3594778.1 hypothetical protein [Polynucleobacter sp. 71A-WALBACH]